MNAEVEAIKARAFVLVPDGRKGDLISQAVWHSSYAEAGRLFAIRYTMDPLIAHIESWVCEQTKHYVVQIRGSYLSTHHLFAEDSKTYGAVYFCRRAAP